MINIVCALDRGYLRHCASVRHRDMHYAHLLGPTARVHARPLGKGPGRLGRQRKWRMRWRWGHCQSPAYLRRTSASWTTNALKHSPLWPVAATAGRRCNHPRTRSGPRSSPSNTCPRLRVAARRLPIQALHPIIRRRQEGGGRHTYLGGPTVYVWHVQ